MPGSTSRDGRHRKAKPNAPVLPLLRRLLASGMRLSRYGEPGIGFLFQLTLVEGVYRNARL
jgi:hypothetical protein